MGPTVDIKAFLFESFLLYGLFYLNHRFFSIIGLFNWTTDFCSIIGLFSLSQKYVEKVVLYWLMTNKLGLKCYYIRLLHCWSHIFFTWYRKCYLSWTIWSLRFRHKCRKHKNKYNQIIPLNTTWMLPFPSCLWHAS